LVNVITFDSAESDPIKRRVMYYNNWLTIY
jgi:hypothetical protein